MVDFLTSTVFRYLIFPIGSAILGVAIKYVTRNDRYKSFQKEDLAVGLELMLTACLTFIALTTDRAVSLASTNRNLAQLLQQTPLDIAAVSKLQTQALTLTNTLATSGYLIAFMLLGLWGISTLVRKRGWKSDTEMHPVQGIAVPLAFGVLSLIVVMAGAAQ